MRKVRTTGGAPLSDYPRLLFDFEVARFFGIAAELDVESDLREEEVAEARHYAGPAGQVIAKVRAAIKKIGLSPLLNDEVIKIAATQDCNGKLVLDVKTRWNSTVRMLKHFLNLDGPLRVWNKGGYRMLGH